MSLNFYNCESEKICPAGLRRGICAPKSVFGLRKYTNKNMPAKR
jgi:hypothetical protein